jgi:hypothetical protein
MEAGSLAGAVGAALTSGVAAICCIGPLALTLLGVNGMIFAAGLRPYRFHLIGASGLMLALAYWMIYRPISMNGAACSIRTTRWTKLTLWVATAVWLAAFVLQFVADTIIL